MCIRDRYVCLPLSLSLSVSLSLTLSLARSLASPLFPPPLPHPSIPPSLSLPTSQATSQVKINVLIPTDHRNACACRQPHVLWYHIQDDKYRLADLDLDLVTCSLSWPFPLWVSGSGTGVTVDFLAVSRLSHKTLRPPCARSWQAFGIRSELSHFLNHS